MSILTLKTTLLLGIPETMLLLSICFILLDGSRYKKKLQNMRFVIMLIISSIFITIINYLIRVHISIIVSTIITPIVICLVLKTIFKYNIKSAISITYISVFIVIIVESIVCPIFTLHILNNNISLDKVLISGFLILVLLFIFVAELYKYHTKPVIDYIKNKKSISCTYDLYLIILMLIFSILFILNYLVYSVKILTYSFPSLLSSTTVIFIETLLCIMLMIMLIFITKDYKQYQMLLNNSYKFLDESINNSTMDDIYDYIAITKSFLEYKGYNDILYIFNMLDSDFKHITYSIDHKIKHQLIDLKLIYDFLEIFMMDIALPIDYYKIFIDIYRVNNGIKMVVSITLNELELRRLLKNIKKNLDIENLRFAIEKDSGSYEMCIDNKNINFYILIPENEINT